MVLLERATANTTPLSVPQRCGSTVCPRTGQAARPPASIRTALATARAGGWLIKDVELMPKLISDRKALLPRGQDLSVGSSTERFPSPPMSPHPRAAPCTQLHKPTRHSSRRSTAQMQANPDEVKR